MKINDSINHIFNNAFRQGCKIMCDIHYSTLAIAVTGVALFTFGSSLSIPCFVTVTGYLLTKSFVMITTQYKLINFDRFKDKIILIQSKPAYYKFIAFLITLTVSFLIMSLGLTLALVLGSYIAMTTELNNYEYNLEMDGTANQLPGMNQ